MRLVTAWHSRHTYQDPFVSPVCEETPVPMAFLSCAAYGTSAKAKSSYTGMHRSNWNEPMDASGKDSEM